MRQLELLSPAKNLACGIAAIDHGADAVYIGASRFGARAAVGNSVDDIRQLCAYAHQFMAKVYVTVNTILYDSELEDTRTLLRQLREAGADAVLVQDMGILRLTANDAQLTGLPLHASTQTDNRTVEKVRQLHELGFRRVVLARELSIDEIRTIHEAVPDVELEVFVHGALCVSYSGICYASQYCFGRSANRGECAQFCRMKFDLLDADGHVLEHDRHLLSLKDMNQLENMERLAEAGAVSFKIEGRLKDADYVKNVTAAYSEKLNALVRKYPDRYCRASEGVCRYTFQPRLEKTFNRGYTTYFADGRQTAIASFDTPKAMGEYVGTVKELRGDHLGKNLSSRNLSFTVAGISRFANGDGLCFVNDDRELEGFRVNRVEGNRLYPHQMPRNLRPGIRLYRNNDQEFERLLAKPSAERKIPVTFTFEAVDGGYRLSCGSCQVTIDCEHQLAQKSQRENIILQLSKLGNTVFVCSGVEVADDFPYFIPSSVLTTMRRELVDQLSKGRNGKQPEPASGEITSAQQGDAAGAPLMKAAAYPFPYLYNIANHEAATFYGVDRPTAYELQGGDGPIMQCRHCLRYALGYCVKHGGRTPLWREPLTLRLSDGRRFPLEFDCRHCQMNVYAK